MSGLEIAGIVLGAFPLAIEGFKAYGNLARRCEIWRHIRKEYQKCLRELKYHHVLFAQHLRCLLLPLVVEPSRIKSLIAHPCGKEWEDIDLDQALRDRLHHSYDVYVDIIGSLQSLLENAKEHLGIESSESLSTYGHPTGEKSNQTSSNGRSVFRENMSFQHERIRFSNGESGRTKFFTALQKYNDRLEKLLDLSDRVRGMEQIIPTSSERRVGSTSDAEICKFWQHAQDVYTAFSDAWTCNCRSQHQTQLMLQHRLKDDKEMQLILMANMPDSNGVPFGHGVTIREFTDLEHIPGDSKEDKPSVQPPKVPKHRTKFPLASVLSKRKSRKAVGSNRAKLHLRNPPMMKMNELPKDGMHGASVNLRSITSLCFKLQEGFKSGASPEYLPGENMKYHVYVRPEPKGKLQLSQSSLEDMLRGTGNKFDRRQRYAISHILASSFIQLQNTSWVVSSWQKSSIIFPEKIEDTDRTDHQKPFMTHHFPARCTNHNAGMPAQDLASLGVTLLELCFGHVIEDHPERVKLSVEGETAKLKALIDSAAASEWLKEVEGEAGTDFTNAIEWCLFKHKTFHDKANWRREMFRQVVRPLSRAMNSWAPQSISM
ncbi:hypothetical protein G7054_g3085 [Neopestalotiopsis clavispora]|nr:hypothetical protein G7054_g3085 [Neopestalotiopsis clavispora]